MTATSENVRRIHHFDDEPELIRWIPSTLYLRYRRRHRDWIRQPEFTESQDGTVTTFTLHPTGVPWRIEYRFYRKTEEFDEIFPQLAVAGDFAFMDLMGFTPERRMVPQGRSRYEVAAGVLGKQSVYFMTAFPQDEALKADIDERYLIHKPPDAQAVVDLIIEKLQVG